jgi:hypothetical protein
MATRPKRPRDPSQLAKLIVDISVGEVPGDLAPTKVQVRGRLGGLKGGKVRAQMLSVEERRKIAKKAARKRWGGA